MKNADYFPKLVSVPPEVLRHPECTLAMLRVAIGLASFDNNNKGYCWAKQSSIAKRLGLGRRAVVKGLADLRKLGLSARATVDYDSESVEAEVFLWSDDLRERNSRWVKPISQVSEIDLTSEIDLVDKNDETDLTGERDRSHLRDRSGHSGWDRSGSKMTKPISGGEIDLVTKTTKPISPCPLLGSEDFKEDLNEDLNEEGGRPSKGEPPPNRAGGSNSADNRKTAESSPSRPDPSGAGARSVEGGERGVGSVPPAEAAAVNEPGAEPPLHSKMHPRNARVSAEVSEYDLRPDSSRAVGFENINRAWAQGWDYVATRKQLVAEKPDQTPDFHRVWCMQLVVRKRRRDAEKELRKLRGAA